MYLGFEELTLDVTHKPASLDFPRVVIYGGGGGGGGCQGFVDRGFWEKLGIDYGLFTSCPLDCGYEMASGLDLVFALDNG